MSRLLLARSDWRFTRSRYASPRTSSPLLSQLLKNAPGLLVLADALLSQYKSQIVDFTIRTQLPTVFPFREFTELSGLMSYGPSLPDMFFGNILRRRHVVISCRGLRTRGKSWNNI